MSREFRLLVEFCRLAFAGAGDVAAEQTADADWQKVLRLARRHRVEGLFAKALAQHDIAIPASARDDIRSAAAEIAAHNLLCAAESKRLADAFAAEDIPLLFVKGLTLGVLAYGDPSTKSAVDIDLLVAPSDVGRAVKALKACSWEAVVPPANIENWHRIHKESIWRSPSTGLQVDLHNRLSDNPRLIPAIGTNSPRQQVAIATGISLPTLASDELFAYLTVHGASSAWFRLKWITDFAALISDMSGGELKRLYERSQELGAGRAPAQALLLADRLYQSLRRAPDLARQLLADRANRRLAAMASTMLERIEEPTEQWLGTLPIHRSQLLLLPGLGFKLGETWRQARAALG